MEHIQGYTNTLFAFQVAINEVWPLSQHDLKRMVFITDAKDTENRDACSLAQA